MAKLVFSRTLDRAPWGSFDDALISAMSQLPRFGG